MCLPMYELKHVSVYACMMCSCVDGWVDGWNDEESMYDYVWTYECMDACMAELMNGRTDERMYGCM